jgi:hypothetical protein
MADVFGFLRHPQLKNSMKIVNGSGIYPKCRKSWTAIELVVFFNSKSGKVKAFNSLEK